MPIEQDPQRIAWFAAQDAGNLSMRRRGGDQWSAEDYNAAVREYQRLTGRLPNAYWPQVVVDTPLEDIPMGYVRDEPVYLSFNITTGDMEVLDLDERTHPKED